MPHGIALGVSGLRRQGELAPGEHFDCWAGHTRLLRFLQLRGVGSGCYTAEYENETQVSAIPAHGDHSSAAALFDRPGEALLNTVKVAITLRVMSSQKQFTVPCDERPQTEDNYFSNTARVAWSIPRSTARQMRSNSSRVIARGGMITTTLPRGLSHTPSARALSQTR